ncbi:hypothetical protein Tco_0619883 [Tanacetum coccineum]
MGILSGCSIGARGIGVSKESDDTMNEDTLVVVASTVKEGVTPSVVDMMVEKENISSLDDTAANITGKPSMKKVNVRTLFTPKGNGIDVVVPVDSIRAISERFANTAYGFFLGEEGGIPFWVNTPWLYLLWLSERMAWACYWSSYARVMIKLRADVELKDNIVVAMPKITRKGHYTCNVRVEYEWKPLRCSSCKVFGHIHDECPKNIGVGEKKTMKNPSQTSRGVPVGPKMGFKPQKEYQHVQKKSTASSSGNKKKGVEPTIEVINSNPFDVLNSVDNDGEFCTNSSNTPIESDSEVEVVFDETANLMIPTSGKDGSDKGYGTNSLLEQWRDSYPDIDDYDPYDDDMYENHDMSEHLQSICDDLDITVRGRKKK